MLESIVLGSGLAFAAAIQPGPLTAFLLSQVAEKGWKRTLPAALAPLCSDGPVAILMLFVLTRLPAGMVPALQMAGGVLLLFFAGSTLSRLNRGGDARQDEKSAVPSSLFKATAVNLVNPGPYLGWGLILGPRALSAWNESPSLATGLVVSFYGTMVVTLAAMIVLFGAAESLSERGRRRLVLLSALTLAGLGIFQLWSGTIQFARSQGRCPAAVRAGNDPTHSPELTTSHIFADEESRKSPLYKSCQRGGSKGRL